MNSIEVFSEAMDVMCRPTAPKATHQDIAIRTKHSLILNRLAEIQRAPCYTSIREEMRECKTLIFEQEQEINRLQAAQKASA